MLLLFLEMLHPGGHLTSYAVFKKEVTTHNRNVFIFNKNSISVVLPLVTIISLVLAITYTTPVLSMVFQEALVSSAVEDTMGSPGSKQLC